MIDRKISLTLELDRIPDLGMSELRFTIRSNDPERFRINILYEIASRIRVFLIEELLV